MIPITMQELTDATAGRLVGIPASPAVTSICTDSRQIAPGALFIALRGENHDGHDYMNQALEAGAAAAMVSDVRRIDRRLHDAGRLVLVSDTLMALGQLAAWYRRQRAAQVIAVVGSNGKTTTKNLIAQVLGIRRRGQASKASFNNSIGVPLTLLSIDASDEYAVVEIGTNHPGEVAALARMAAPNMAVVTSIGEEHLEFFGDVAGVAREEFSVLDHLRDRSWVAVEYSAMQHAPDKAIARHTIFTYGTDASADLRATEISVTDEGQRFKVNGRAEFALPLFGTHNVSNALAAIAVGTRFRLTDEDIAAGLALAKPGAMRLEVADLGGITLINDAYNANPASMKAAFDVLDRWPSGGRRVLIVGDMGELGEAAESCHRSVGRDAGRSTAQVIVAVGGHARVVTDGAIATSGMSKRIYTMPSVGVLTEKLATIIEPGDVVLIKASRRMRLEQIVEPLRQLGNSAVGA